MTMHSAIETRISATDSVGCVRDLLIAALGVVDELDLPGEIGAHLDLAIHRLGAFLPDAHDAPFEALPA